MGNFILILKMKRGTTLKIDSINLDAPATFIEEEEDLELNKKLNEMNIRSDEQLQVPETNDDNTSNVSDVEPVKISDETAAPTQVKSDVYQESEVIGGKTDKDYAN